MFSRTVPLNRKASWLTTLMCSRRDSSVTSLDVLAVDEDPAAGGFVEHGQQIDEGGFAGAGRADERDHFAGLRVEADILQRHAGPRVWRDAFGRRADSRGLAVAWTGRWANVRRAEGVAEADVLIHDIPAHRLAQWRPEIGALLGGIEDVKYAGGGGAGGLEDLVQAVEASDGFVEEDPGIEKEGDELAHVHSAAHDIGAAHPEDEADARGTDELHGGAVGGPGAHDDERAVSQVVRALGEAPILVRLAAEGFDLADALQVVHEQGVHGAGGFALQAIALVRRERVPERAAHQEGHGCQCHHRQEGIGKEHESQGSQDAQQRDRSLFDAVDQQPLDVVHVFDDPGHEVARGALVEPGYRQPLEAGVDIPAHVEHDVLFEPIVDADPEAVKKFAEQERGDQPGRREGELMRAPAADDVLDDDAGEIGVEKAEREREDGTAHGSQDQSAVWRQVGADAAHDLACRARPGFKGRVGMGAVSGMNRHGLVILQNPHLDKCFESEGGENDAKSRAIRPFTA